MPLPEIPGDLRPLIDDPRSAEDFDADCFPAACFSQDLHDGSDDQDAGSGRNRSLRLSFLSVYYRMNCVHRSLGLEPEGSPRRAELLRNLADLWAARDALEDHAAPIGFIGEPLVEGARVCSVRFTAPPTRPPAAPPPSSFSLKFTLDDLLSGTPGSGQGPDATGWKS